MCHSKEWETNYPLIDKEMSTGTYKTVTDLMKARPNLKMKEFSKQYVRDALLDMGFDPSKHTSAPQLTEDQVVECAHRYISLCNRITDTQFEFPAFGFDPQTRILKNL